MRTSRRGRRAAGGLALAGLLVAGACGGGSSSSGPVATRPDGTTLPTGVGIPDPRTTSPASDRRSQPYWVPVTTLSGNGNQTTAPFAVDAGALQWRASWHCETGSLAAVAVKDGKDLKKKLVDVPTCPQDGKDFSTQTGSFALRVAAGGPWKIDVEQQVDAPLVEPPPPGLETAKLLATARMYDIDRKGEGTAKIYELGDGSRLLRLDDFFVTINSDLEIRLSEPAQPRSTDEVVAAMPTSVTVAPLKATIGSMNYPLSPGLDLAKYHSIVIWCEITRNAYAAASIENP